MQMLGQNYDRQDLKGSLVAHGTEYRAQRRNVLRQRLGTPIDERDGKEERPTGSQFLR